MLIDSHCHLNFPDFKADLESCISRAADNGVDGMVSICTSLEEFEEVYAIAKAHSNVWCSLGVHPDSADEKAKATVEKLLELGGRDKVIGIGETGLDYYRGKQHEPVQKESFEIHIEAARRLKLPLIVHSREADSDMADILQTESSKPGGIKGVLHCFTSTRELAFKALDAGFYISFSGIITFKNAMNLRQIAREIPLDRILIETDAPFLAPQPYRGKRNEPAFVKHTAECLAGIREISLGEIAAATTANFYELFDKSKVRL